MKILFAALTLTLGLAPANAGTDTGLHIVSPTEAPKEKRVCKRVTETGSFTRVKKVCMTVAEREQMARQGKEIGRDMQTRISTEQGR